MKKLVISLLLSLVLIAGTNSAYSFAQTDGLVQSGANLEQKCLVTGVCDKHQVKLEEKAKAMGITVDELKAKMKAEHQAKLEKKAKEMGITVDQLKAKLTAERQAKLEKKAKEMGITVDELKAKIKAKHEG